MVNEKRLIDANEVARKLAGNAGHILRQESGEYSVGRARGIMDAVDLINKSPTEAKRYNIYYRKYNIIANDYIPYIKVVHTDDIYHEVGKIICKSMEKIECIRYTESRASQERLEQLWTAEGYRKLTDDIWVCDGERREGE